MNPFKHPDRYGSRRERRRRYHERQESELRQLWSRYNELLEAKWNAPLIKLENPYRHGYCRRFKLRDDVARRQDAYVFHHILDRLQNEKWCARRDFCRKSYKTKQLEPIEQTPRDLTQEEYNKLPQKLRRYFVLTKVTRQLWHDVQEYYVWCFRHPEYFEFEVYPYIVTHRKMLIPEVEKELGEVRERLSRDNLYSKCYRYGIFNNYYDWYDKHPSAIYEEILDEEMREIIDTVQIAKSA